MSDEIPPALPPDTSPEDIGAKLAEMVEAEALAAEAETPSDEPDPDNPDDEETAANAAIMEALGNYLAVVQSVMGENAPISPCVFCHGFGFNSIELADDPYSHRCEVCHGHGRVYTGSLVPGNETRTCDGCRGTGFQAESAAGITPDIPAETPEIKVLSPAEVEQIAAQARQTVAGHAA